MASKRASKRALGALAVCVALGGCGRGDETSAQPEALIDGREDFVRVGDFRSDYDASSFGNWARNATVMVVPRLLDGSLDFSSSCSGVLVSPRIVLTAAHCVGRAGTQGFDVFFGPLGFPTLTGFPGGLALTSDGVAVPGTSSGDPLERTVATQLCVADEANALGVTCNRGGPVPANVSPTDSDFDLAVLSLIVRVDHHQGDPPGGIAAVPATPVRTPPALVQVTHAGFGEVSTCPSFGGAPLVPVLRQSAIQNILCAASAPSSSICFDHLLTLTPYAGQHGDSGGPIYLGDTRPSVSVTSPLTVAGVFSQFVTDDGTRCGTGAHDFAVSLGDPAVVTFLERFLGAGYAGTMLDVGTGPLVWTGGDDVPRINDPGRSLNDNFLDPDGDGLVAEHDNCWGVNAPTQALLGSECMLPVWRPTDPDLCATEVTMVRTPVPCVLPGAPNLCGRPQSTELPSDSDGDGIPDPCDLCRCLAGAPQTDCDGDGLGDACDPDFANSCGALLASRPSVPMDCNADAEMHFVAPQHRDECDTTPCVGVEPTSLPRRRAEGQFGRSRARDCRGVR